MTRHSFFVPLLVCLSTLAGCEPNPTMTFTEAIEQGNLAEMKACMAHSKFDTADGPLDKTGRMPLHAAAESDQAKSAEFLISRGADVNTVGIWGWKEGTPLHVAAAKGNLSVAKVLLAHGARTDIPDEAGRTASGIVAASGNAEMQALFAHLPSESKSKGKQ